LLATPASRAAPNFLLGVLGNADRFQAQTGQDSQARQSLVGWGQGVTWGAPLPALLTQHVPVPLIGTTTDSKPPRRSRRSASNGNGVRMKVPGASPPSELPDA
jgi:hypothetical protein